MASYTPVETALHALIDVACGARNLGLGEAAELHDGITPGYGLSDEQKVEAAISSDPDVLAAIRAARAKAESGGQAL